MTSGGARLLYLAEESDRTGPAGALLSLIPRLVASRFAPVVIFRHDAGPVALSLQRAGATVLDLGVSDAPAPRGFVAGTVALHRLVAIMKDLAPAIAHGLDEPSSRLVSVAGRIAGVPILIGTWRAHGARRPSWSGRAALRRLDRFVVPSEALRTEASELLRGRHPPFTVIPDGIDARGVRGHARDPEFSEPRLRVGTFARLANGCGVEDLIEAAVDLLPRMPDFEWLVCGVGRDAIPLLRMTRRRGVDAHVRLLGDREDAGAFLASLDAYVDPGSPDAIPTGLLQALAAGLPCVAVTNSSLAQMLADGRDAVLVPAGPAALADAVARVLGPDGHELRARLGECGPRAARPLSADVTASAIRDLYVSLMADARSDPG